MCKNIKHLYGSSIWAESVHPKLPLSQRSPVYSTPSFLTRCLLTSCAQMAGRNWCARARSNTRKHAYMHEVALEGLAGAFVLESKDVIFLASTRPPHTSASIWNRCPNLTCDWRQTWTVVRKGQEFGCFSAIIGLVFLFLCKRLTGKWLDGRILASRYGNRLEIKELLLHQPY